MGTTIYAREFEGRSPSLGIIPPFLSRKGGWVFLRASPSNSDQRDLPLWEPRGNGDSFVQTLAADLAHLAFAGDVVVGEAVLLTLHRGRAEHQPFDFLE